MPEPELSVIVPLFNRSVYTRILILALGRVLPESPRTEVILVDNGSSDDTHAVLAELVRPPFRVVSLTTNRNFAGRHAGPRRETGAAAIPIPVRRERGQSRRCAAR